MFQITFLVFLPATSVVLVMSLISSFPKIEKLHDKVPIVSKQPNHTSIRANLSYPIVSFISLVYFSTILDFSLHIFTTIT